MEYHTPGSHAHSDSYAENDTNTSSTKSELDSDRSSVQDDNGIQLVDGECVETLPVFLGEEKQSICEEAYDRELRTTEALNPGDDPEEIPCKSDSFLTLKDGDDRINENSITNNCYLETSTVNDKNVGPNIVSVITEDIVSQTQKQHSLLINDELCGEIKTENSRNRSETSANDNSMIRAQEHTSLSSSISDLTLITDENRDMVNTPNSKSGPKIEESVQNVKLVDSKAIKSVSNYELSTKSVDEIGSDMCALNAVVTLTSEEVLRSENQSSSPSAKHEYVKQKLKCPSRTDIEPDKRTLSEKTHDSVKEEIQNSGSIKSDSPEKDKSVSINQTDKFETVAHSLENMDELETSLRRRGIHDKPKRDSSDKESPPQEEWEREKVRRIMAEVRRAAPDREALKQMAIGRGGLLNNRLRRLAWPLLLAVDVSDVSPKPEQEELRAHRDYEQVVLDVNRSLKRFPPGMEEVERLSMQDQLVDCIMRVLCARPDLHYYQGYHDIVVTFLLVVGEDITFALMNELSMKHLRDFMYETMDKTTGMLHYLYPLLGKPNSKLRIFMEQAEVGTIFALAWLITWFGHVLGDIRHIVRLYDFFIACHPLMPIYLAAAIVLYRAEEILSCPPEMPIIHCLLSKIPPDLPIEKLIREAGELFVLYPPESLEQEANAQYEAYLAENERKRAQLQQLSRARAARGHKRSHSWWARAQPKPSALVKVTVWTSAALLSAAAVSYYIAKSSNYDHMFDLHWLWGS